MKTSNLDNKNKISIKQDQTKRAFAFQWAMRDAYDSRVVRENTRICLMERYCDGRPCRLSKWLKGGRKIILDAGCGSGFSALLFFGKYLKNHDYIGVDISDAIKVAKVRFAAAGYTGNFLKMNLLDIPIRDGTVDIVFSEGVLHHTDSTEKCLKFLVRKLKKGGRFLFYIYAKKGPVREFTDDYIRKCLAKMTNEEAWKALKPLTKLGMELGKANIKINIPEDIDFLKIQKGKIDLQRFFYWNICKMFYYPEYSLDEMNHMNFDWFRPFNCHRHTPDEIKKWCSDSNLAIEHINVQESGITVVAIKK